MKKAAVKKKSLRNFNYLEKISRATPKQMVVSLFVLLFATVGVYFLFFVRAETPYSVYKYPLYTSYDDETAALAGSVNLAERGTVTGYPYWHVASTKPAYMYFHDTSSGNKSYVALNGIVGGGEVLWAKDNSLWFLSGGGPVKLTHFSLDNAALPSSAELISTATFGDSDSRPNDIIQLESGALVAHYMQQSTDSMTFLYLAPGSSTWQQIVTTNLRTKSSKCRLDQHPTDKSVWAFCIPDAWGAMQAVHLTESAGGLRIDWTNDRFIDGINDGSNEPDPENADIVTGVDALTGEIVVAYQSAQRQLWKKDPSSSCTTFYIDCVNVSYPVVARVKPDGTKTFVTLPIYVERIADLGMVVRPGEVWLAYRPVDPDTFAFNQAYTSVYRNGAWEAPIYLGQLRAPGDPSDSTTTISWAPILSGINRPEFAAPLFYGNGGSKINFMSMINAGAYDLVAPGVNILTPIDNSTVSGTAVTVNVSASDNVKITNIYLYIDNQLLDYSYGGQLSATFDTYRHSDGTHSLTAKAYDNSGNMTSTTITIQIKNSSVSPPPPSADTTIPTVTIMSPLANNTISGTVNVSASSTDNVGVTRSELYIDGKLVTKTNGPNINYSWNTKRLKRGTHKIEVRAYDAAGNLGSSLISVQK